VIRERPLEPDTDNTGVGIWELEEKATVSRRDAVFRFMRLKVNGDTIEISGAGNVGELLHELGIESGRVAVEVNLSIVRKSEYGKVRLHEGDSVEIVNFVGGG